MIRMIFVMTALLPFFCTSPASAEAAFPSGLWEMTATMEIQGLAPGLSRPHVYRRCLTGKDPIPREPERDRQCRLLWSSLEGDALTWSVQCEMDTGSMTGKGRVLFRGETLTGVMKGKILGKKGKTLSVTQRIEGRRIGDCPKATEDPHRSGTPPR